jgi:hypothetical protein
VLEYRSHQSVVIRLLGGDRVTTSLSSHSELTLTDLRTDLLRSTILVRTLPYSSVTGTTFLS